MGNDEKLIAALLVGGLGLIVLMTVYGSKTEEVKVFPAQSNTCGPCGH